MDDDLNTPNVMALIDNLIKLCNVNYDEQTANDVLAILDKLDKHPKMVKKVLLQKGMNLDDQEEVNHQGYIAEVKEFNYTPFNELVTSLKDKEKSLVLILDQIHDPHNFGSIIRTASLVGVDAIIILDKKQIMVNHTVVKEAVDIRKVDFASKSAIIVGNEQKGVSELLTKNSDMNIFLPSTKSIDSYNVGVASALVLYDVANKIVNCQTGHEEKVKSDLLSRIKSDNLENQVFDVKIAQQKVLVTKELKSGEVKKEIKDKNKFPGYIFINMNMSEKT
ncbi:hypothetical protein FQA39_LY12787 [Lamprigera yunnana]|nr:hypothetical protein FQA39_LY12787 [Lamprigera yunnana]